MVSLIFQYIFLSSGLENFNYLKPLTYVCILKFVFFFFFMSIPQSSFANPRLLDLETSSGTFFLSAKSYLFYVHYRGLYVESFSKVLGLSSFCNLLLGTNTYLLPRNCIYNHSRSRSMVKSFKCLLKKDLASRQGYMSSSLKSVVHGKESEGY